MAQGGTGKAEKERVAKELEEVQEALNAEASRWDDAGLPFVGNVFELGPNQFMLLVHTMALSTILQKYLGIDGDVLQMEIKKHWLEQMKILYEPAIQARRQSLIAQIMPQPPGADNGGGIIRPPGSN